jgi:hypothetical protein
MNNPPSHKATAGRVRQTAFASSLASYFAKPSGAPLDS